jgi:SSS family transporter
MAIVIFLPALALASVTGFNIYVCILAMGLVSTLYTVLGGIEAVIWTDVLQVFILLGGAFLSLIIILFQIDGGVSGFFECASDAHKFHFINWTWDYTVTAVWVVFIGNLLANLVPYTTDQSVVQRYLTTPDEKQAARSIYTNALLSIPSGLLFFSLGTALFVFYKTRPALLHPAMPTDTIFPWFIFQQLPAGISGLVIAGLFAAAMSTLDSSLNSLAAVLVTDYYRRFKAKANDLFCLKMSRWITAVLGLFATATACVMATYKIQSLWDLFIQLLGLLGGSLAGVFALGIFTKRANGTGTFLGASVSAGFLFWVQRYTQVHFFLFAGIGIVGCFIAGYFFSLIFPSEKKSLAGLTIFTKNESRK